MSLTATFPASMAVAICGAQPGRIAAAAPALATDSRNSRLDIMRAPDDRLRGNDPLRGAVNHPQRDSLDDVVQRVVIEIQGMHSDSGLLHCRPCQNEGETGDSPRQCRVA